MLKERILFLAVVLIAVSSGSLSSLDLKERKKSIWEVQIGYPFSFNVSDPESLSMYDNPEENNYEGIYFGIRTHKTIGNKDRWSIGFSLSAFDSPLERFGLDEVLGIDTNLQFVITGAAVSYFFVSINRGPFITLSGGTALINFSNRGQSYDEFMSSRYYGHGIELSLGYSFPVRRNFTLSFAAKATYCGAYIDIISDYWGFFNLSFYIGFSI